MSAVSLLMNYSNRDWIVYSRQGSYNMGCCITIYIYIYIGYTYCRINRSWTLTTWERLHVLSLSMADEKKTTTFVWSSLISQSTCLSTLCVHRHIYLINHLYVLFTKWFHTIFSVYLLIQEYLFTCVLYVFFVPPLLTISDETVHSVSMYYLCLPVSLNQHVHVPGLWDYYIY